MKGKVDIMKKRLTALSLALIIFNTGFVYAEQGTIIKKENITKQNVEEEITVDVNIMLEELEKAIEKQIGVTNDEEIDDEQLEEAVNQVLDAEEYEDKNRLETTYLKGQEKAQEITNIIESQYNMKKQFILNNKGVLGLTYEIQKDLRYLALETKVIVRNKDKTIDKETYGEIRENINHLKTDIRQNDYIIGNIAKETKNYIKLVINKQFKEANKTFKKILVLQEQQIDLLKVINKNITELKVILANV